MTKQESLNLEAELNNVDLNTQLEDPIIDDNNDEDELLDVVVSATITDGHYEATLIGVEPVKTQYTKEEDCVIAGKRTKRLVQKQGKVYNFKWKLTDGRILTDSRFTRDSDDFNIKYQAINIALGNIATQLGIPTLTLRELVDLKPTVNLWVSRYGKNRNVDYLQPTNVRKEVIMNNELFI